MQKKKKERVNKPRVKLTKKLIDSLTCPDEEQDFYRDTEIPGFAVRLTKGAKTFVLERKINGRSRRITLGPYGALTVDQARKIASEYVGRIAKGEDPAQDKITRREEMTFEDLVTLFTEQHIKRKSKNTADLYTIILRTHLKGLYKRKLSSIARADIARLHADIGKKAPYTANRMIAVVRKMFNLGKVWGAFKGDNPAQGIEMFTEEKRDRFLRPDEIPALIEALREETDPYIKGAFIVMLLTGARKSEVLTLRWEDLDLQQGLWRIPQTKAGRPHYIPLPRPVMALIQTLPRMKDNPHVFCGRVQGAPLVSVKGAWERIRTRAGIKDVRIHDLRRTLGSWLAGSGESLPLIGKVLNHSQPSTTAIYARLALDPVRAALEANAARMLAVAGNMNVLEGVDNE